jgi:hypothetical protein
MLADGNEVRKSEIIMPDKLGIPKDNLEIATLINEGQKDMYNDWRTYIRIIYQDKIRSTLYSTFLRFSRVGTDLFVECSFYVLPPINEDVYNIDKMAIHDELRIIKIGIATAGLSLLAIIAKDSPESSIVLLFVTIYPICIILKERIEEFFRNRQLKKKIEYNEAHNYGRFSTFRESIASTNYKNYFSAQDIIMIQNGIEQAIVFSVADLLDLKGIDSSALRKDVISYINQGIMMFGGKLEAEQVTAGVGSHAIKQIKDQTQRFISAHLEASK